MTKQELDRHNFITLCQAQAFVWGLFSLLTIISINNLIPKLILSFITVLFLLMAWGASKSKPFVRKVESDE